MTTPEEIIKLDDFKTESKLKRLRLILKGLYMKKYICLLLLF